MRRLRYPDGLANGTPREKNHVACMLELARLGLWPASAARLRPPACDGVDAIRDELRCPAAIHRSHPHVC